MRILIDLQGAQNNSRQRGIGRYSLALAKGIARNAGEHQIFVLLNGLFPETIQDIKDSFSGLLDADRFLVFHAPGPVAELVPENDWRRLTGELLREHVIDTLAPDALLITSLVEGAEDDTLASLGRVRSTVATSVVLYDLIPLTDPERYIGWGPLKTWYHAKIDSMRRADLLFAISQSAAGEAINLLGAEPTRVNNISSAADGSFSSLHVTAQAAEAVAHRLGIRRKYVMHSSAFEARKNFQGLIRAYAALPMAVRAEHQLVLVCKLPPAGRKELETLAGQVGLTGDELVLTGFVSDSDLVALYIGCHLFVFPSLHEGFGLPALEAMSCGAAAIGSNTTSIPEVIGRPDALFDPTSDKSMTDLMQKVLTTPHFHQSLRDHAKLQAARFSWDETARTALGGLEELVARRKHQGSVEDPAVKQQKLLEALAEFARRMVPSEADLRDLASSIEANDRAVNLMKASAAFSGPLTWRIEGPFDSTYSLALLNRETARALGALGHKVVLHSTEGPGDFDANPYFLQLNPDLEAMHARVATHPHDQVDAVSRNLYPPRVADMSSGLNLLHHYAWEESGFPRAWVDNFNEHLDGLTCLSNHVEKLMLDNGVRVPMTTSGCGVDHWERIEASEQYRVDARGFRFLHVSSCFPRKGVDALLGAFGKAFSDADDVSLIVKTFANPHNEIHELLARHRSRSPSYPHVVVIELDLPDADLKALYQQCQALVAPSRAEGFGLPLAEAMLSGLPVVTTGWGGQLDFCTAENAWLVDYTFKRADTHFGLFASVWADPSIDALAKALLEVRSAPASLRNAKARAGREMLLEGFRWRDVAARLVMAARSWKTAPAEPGAPRIGWISTWNTKCGIAAYSQHLIDHFPKPVTLLAPHQEGRIGEDGPDCIRSWFAEKEENGFEELGAQIDRLGLDTLVLQFNYGFYNFRQLNQFIGEQISDGRIVIAVMHSTGDPGLLPEWNWSLSEIVPALARCQRVLVHSPNDLNRMKELGLVGNVSLFPLGVLDVPATKKTRARHSTPLIASYGYCLPHKGLVELVHAVDRLRKLGKPVRLRLVNAEYPAPVSAEIVAQIGALVKELSLEDLVEAHHDYLSDEDCLRLLDDADLLVYPYQQTNESASAAVRFGIATDRPVAVTPLPIFDDLGGAVHRMAGVTPEALAQGILSALKDIEADGESSQAIVKAADRWRAEHSYAALSSRLHNICLALWRGKASRHHLFDGSSHRFGTAVGTIHGRSMVSSGVAGYLLYGPYLTLPAGRYEVVVTGNCRLPAGSTAYIDAASNNGQSVLGRVDLRRGSGPLNARIAIHLLHACRDLEVRMVVDALADCRVDQVEVRPTTGPDALGFVDAQPNRQPELLT